MGLPGGTGVKLSAEPQHPLDEGHRELPSTQVNFSASLSGLSDLQLITATQMWLIEKQSNSLIQQSQGQ